MIKISSVVQGIYYHYIKIQLVIICHKVFQEIKENYLSMRTADKEDLFFYVNCDFRILNAVANYINHSNL